MSKLAAGGGSSAERHERMNQDNDPNINTPQLVLIPVHAVSCRQSRDDVSVCVLSHASEPKRSVALQYSAYSE